jgi:hypothetical protein
VPERGICPSCGEGPRELRYIHPKTRKYICLYCYFSLPEKLGICARCGQGPKPLPHRDPKTKERICANCYKKLPERIGICSRCGRGPKLLPHRDRGTGGRICSACYVRSRYKKKREEKRLLAPSEPMKPATSHETPVSPVAVRTVEPGRIISRRREDAKKPGRKARYPTKEVVIATLEDREAQGKENFPGVLQPENAALYCAALRFGVELPTKKNPPNVYYPGDLVENLKDPSLRGVIGKVLYRFPGTSEDEVRVSFGEPRRVIRFYKKWENLNNITLHARKSAMMVKVAEKEAVPA